MKGLLKILLGLIGVLVVVIAAAAVIIPMYVDPNDYKDDIAALVKKQTGRDLQIPGDLSITVFPWLGVTTGKLVFSNAEGFGEAPMVQAEGIEVRVKLLPLLRKEIEMGTVIIDRLDANLARDAQGRTNWDDLIKAAEQAPAEPQSDEQSGLALAGLAVGGLDISDSRVSWVDKQNDQRYLIEDLNLETGALKPGEPIDIDLDLAFEASDPELKGTLALAGTVSYDLEQQQYQLAPLTLESNLEGPQLPGGNATIDLSADTLAADLKNNSASVRALSLTALNTRVEGDIEAQNIDRRVPGLKGFFRISGDSLPALLKALDQGELAAQLEDKPAEFSLNANFDADANAGTAQISELEVALLGAELAGELNAAQTDTDNPAVNGQFDISGLGLDARLMVSAKNLLNQPSYNGKLQLAEFNPRKLMQELAIEPPRTADEKVLTKLALESDYAGTANSVSLSNLSLTLDDTKANGSLSIANIANQALRFDLNIDQINADRYLPPPAEGEEEAPATPETAGAGAAAELPLETLRALDIKGNLKIGQLTINKAKLSDVSLALNAQNGVIALSPVNAKLYDGSYDGAVNLNATGEQPRVQFTTKLAGVNIEPLLDDMTGDAKLTGTADINADLNARGGDAEAMKKTLGGTADLLFKNGAYKGINLGHILRQANAVLEGQSLKEVPESEQTDFSEMTATLNIKDGVIKNDDLSAKSPALRVAGAGEASLVSEAIDYTVKASVAKTTKGQGGEGLDAVGGYTVPVRCQGTFAEPGCKPDFQGLVKAKVDKAIDEQTEKAEEKIKKKLEEELGEGAGDKLKDALGF
ncbi:AsmA protein [Methylohalomonas lacus]|uniref:AsmA protein n=1 Tax=Methylohalomonas lacus TaxID=398773 RepID=A0AAE3HMP9_9GAMM|nr:AsmA family protein [Methylohalomonas lacus]MCS3904158.1 AsmA protein [Methylohalomonas lacus]